MLDRLRTALKKLRLSGLSESLEPARVPGVQCVAYRSRPLTYRVCLSLEDHAVSTAVHLAGEEETLVSYLEEVVPAAGLGSRQSVPTSARPTIRGTSDAFSSGVACSTSGRSSRTN